MATRMPTLSALVAIIELSCCLLFFGDQAESQLTVIDPANLTQNTISAVQNTITAIYQIESVLNQILELMPLDEIILSAEFIGALEDVAALIAEAQGLGGNHNRLGDGGLLLRLEIAQPHLGLAIEPRLSEEYGEQSEQDGNADHHDGAGTHDAISSGLKRVSALSMTLEAEEVLIP